ncbi:hypothetical protein EIP91_008240 [Steccherinum ochraceum]|uniref:Uncharacterized protein n=1 Tax=Steccherinum ochraceum TaxID=92696 RepID=A0A4R0R5G8_9APHY|nr:hypothetical protein EIP91_008240 [Steccherinum ochraceum]
MLSLYRLIVNDKARDERFIEILLVIHLMATVHSLNISNSVVLDALLEDLAFRLKIPTHTWPGNEPEIYVRSQILESFEVVSGQSMTLDDFKVQVHQDADNEVVGYPRVDERNFDSDEPIMSAKYSIDPMEENRGTIRIFWRGDPSDAVVDDKDSMADGDNIMAAGKAMDVD